MSSKTEKITVEWGLGKENFRDAPTKHYPVSHHKKIRPINLYVKGKSPSSLKGCIKLITLDPVTQPKKNIVTATAALTLRLRFSKRLNSRLNSLILSQRSPI